MLAGPLVFDVRTAVLLPLPHAWGRGLGGRGFLVHRAGE